jgi:hypothetical protein
MVFDNKKIEVGDCVLNRYDYMYEIQNIRAIGQFRENRDLVRVFDDDDVIVLQLLDMYMLTGELVAEMKGELVVTHVIK